MNIAERHFAGATRILDVGGWFNPEPRATHVVDLMPWETRRAKLSLAPLPNECFTKATWVQVDFLASDLKLPFSDGYFDLVLCGQTIEDLADPVPVLREMERVGARGVIECPSRMNEQTKGMRDRESSEPGHPHHHWIVESLDGALCLYAKTDSDLRGESRLLPLSYTERRVQANAAELVTVHSWAGRIDWRMVTGPECKKRAEAFVRALRVSPLERAKDAGLRFLRRTRRRWRGGGREDFSWWQRIVAESRPYSSIELKS